MGSGGQLLGFACWSEGASHEYASGMGCMKKLGHQVNTICLYQDALTWPNMVEPPKDVFEGVDQVEVKHYDGCVFNNDREEVKKYGTSQVGSIVV